ncbi:hypothetical protein HPB51_018531 [Rhipicephalus microplus]|uniref:THAP-type domain-containing protein n=1 Tax=Rhipicephalus microplus TaxID=6941 RepID=A0A9J6DJ17_RHIMP|nr:hypothetical protein HPB51_018531 [Rhipicephalus microplus]
MPNKCCVPGCTDNYKTGKKIQVFSFPKDADALKQWLRAIPRKDFVPTSCTKVCADHFDASCIEKTTSYTDPRTGRVIEVALAVPRLRPGSVPTVFPGCPSYLSVRDQSTRETPDAKRSRQEASQLARAVEESLASYEAEQERDRFSSLEELRARLQGVSVSPMWTVFNPHVAEALSARKGHTDFQHATATAEFIKIILRWWSIVNVETPSKGFHHRNVYEEPMSNHTDDPKASFLSAFITWLDVWELYRHDTGVLTQETLSALRLSAQSLLALVKYCVSELHFKYILLGKVQTDPLESRFGQYRQMAGGQYHISVRQLCGTEGRIRLQYALPRMSNDDLRGIEETDSVRDAGTSFSVHVSDADLDELRAQMPVIGYVGGYCAHAAMKVLKCESCQRQLVVTGNAAETGEDTHSLIAQLDRGGLKFPSALVIAVVMYTEVVVRKLMTESTSTQFLHGPNQKNVVRQLTLDSLPRLEDIDTCENGHTYELLVTLVANCAANIMLNNLCKQRNDLLRIEKDQKAKNRKARIFLGK